MENPSPKARPAAKVHDMTREEFREELAPLLSRMIVLETKVSALPDKAAVFTSAFTVHAMFWGTIGGTIGLLKAFGAF